MEGKMCGEKKFCYCQALAAILIIIFVWTAPSWANIAITILAILVLFLSGGCYCDKMKMKKEKMNSEHKMPEDKMPDDHSSF